MKQIKDKLKVIAKTGGIKLASDPEKWINPTDNSKDKILGNLEQIRKWRDCEVLVDMIGEDNYCGIGIIGETKEANLSDKHVINIRGKEFVTHEGLLDVAHKKGLKSIQTEMVDYENKVFKATVVMKDDSTFSAYGDASKDNVNENIRLHILRMAETRAINRALRLATNVGMCSTEELKEVGEKEIVEEKIEVEDIQNGS